MNGFGILLYLEDTMDICRFLIQVLAHPHYSAHAESSNKHISVLLNSFAEKLKKEYTLEDSFAIGVAYGINNFINGYILRTDKEVFLLQMKALFSF